MAGEITAKAYKLLETGLNEDSRIEYLEYDFSKDTGAQGTYWLGKFQHKALIKSAVVFVETACTSGGSATVAVGTTTADPDGFLDATSGAVANLIDDAALTETTAANLVVAANEYVIFVIGGADLTAGKVKVIIEWVEVN